MIPAVAQKNQTTVTAHPMKSSVCPITPAQKPISDVVNVASVPHRSPFRYPGGKTWLVPQIRTWLKSLGRQPALLVEPFAGGASIGLAAAIERLATKVLLVELDEDVAAVWQTVLGPYNEWLARKVLDFDLTEQTARSVVTSVPKTTKDRAFQTIFRNRVLYGGILAPGSSFGRFGEDGRGIRSRWYPATLARRIQDIATLRDRVEFRCEDGVETIRRYGNRADNVFFVDPPYTAGGKRAGKRLYVHQALNHDRLFRTLARAKGDFVMTYDRTEEIEAMALHYGFAARPIAMKSNHHAVMKELLISRNLDWLS